MCLEPSGLIIVPNWHVLLTGVDKVVRDKAARTQELCDWALTARRGATPAHACRRPAAVRYVVPGDLHPPEPLPTPIFILLSSSSPVLLPLTFPTRFLALPPATEVSTMECRMSLHGSHSPGRLAAPAPGATTTGRRRGPREVPKIGAGRIPPTISEYRQGLLARPGAYCDVSAARVTGCTASDSTTCGGRRSRWPPPHATQALVAVGPFTSSGRRRLRCVLPLCSPPDGAYICRWPCLGRTCGASGQSLFCLWLAGW